jgi:hypothetical protein
MTTAEETASLLQLIYPGVMATGNSQRVDIVRGADVPDDHVVVRLAHGFARSEGLVLHHYQRAGMPRQIPDDWEESTKRLLRATRKATSGVSYEVFVRPDAESIPEVTRSRDDLGLCYIATAGIVLNGEQAVLNFLESNQ